MCVSHKISVFITKTIFSCISLKLVPFSFRPIKNPGPSQCVPFWGEVFFSSNLTDMVKIRISEFYGKNNFCPTINFFPACWVMLNLNNQIILGSHSYVMHLPKALLAIAHKLNIVCHLPLNGFPFPMF